MEDAEKEKAGNWELARKTKKQISYKKRNEDGNCNFIFINLERFFVNKDFQWSEKGRDEIKYFDNKEDAIKYAEEFIKNDSITKNCSHCGKETWACGCGGHGYSETEKKDWEKKFGKSTDYRGFPKENF